VSVLPQNATSYELAVIVDNSVCQASALKTDGSPGSLVYTTSGELTVGKTTGKGQKLKFSSYNVAIDCALDAEYSVTFDYGTLSAASHLFDEAMAVGLTFNMSVYDASYTTALSTAPSQAGKTIYLGLKIDESHNLGDHITFAPKSCQVTDGTTNYTLFDTANSCENSQIDLEMSYDGASKLWKFQHILFLIDSDATSSYTLTCQVVVCDVNMPAGDNQCKPIHDSCAA